MKESDLLKDYYFPKAVEKKLNKIANATNLTDQEKMEQIVDVMIKYVPSFFERLTGIKVKLDPKKKQVINSIVKGSIIGFVNAFEEASKLPEDAFCERLKLITAPFLNIFNSQQVNTNKHYESLFEYFYDYFNGMLFFDPTGSFLSQTKLMEYRKELYKLLDIVLSKQESAAIYRQLISNESFQSDYLLDLLGSKKFIFLGDYYEFLNKKFERMTGKYIERLIKIYYELAETVTKLIAVVRILIDFTEGNIYPNLDQIYKDSLGNHIHRIQNSKDFKSLGEVEIVIRNSISHHTFSYDIRNRQIIFKDRKSIIVMTPNEFLMKVRNLSALTITLGNLQIYDAYRNNLQILDLCFPSKFTTSPAPDNPTMGGTH